MEYRKAQTKHEEELHTIEHLRNELVKSHLKPKKPKFIKDVEVVEPEPKPSQSQEKEALPVRQAHKAEHSVELDSIHNQASLERQEMEEEENLERKALRKYKKTALSEQREMEQKAKGFDSAKKGCPNV